MPPDIRPDATLTLTQPCSDCEGSGHTGVRGACVLCGASHTPAQMAAAGDLQPCQHPWTAYHEEDFCYECEGTGKVVRAVTLQQLADVIVTLLAAPLKLALKDGGQW